MAVGVVQSTGKICILDVEVNGVKNIKNTDLNARYFFVQPPSIEALVSLSWQGKYFSNAYIYWILHELLININFFETSLRMLFSGSLESFITFLERDSKQFIYIFYYFFSVRLLSVLRGHSVFSSPPQRPMTSDIEGFSIPDFIHYIYFPILILEKEPVFSLLNVQC